MCSEKCIFKLAEHFSGRNLEKTGALVPLTFASHHEVCTQLKFWFNFLSIAGVSGTVPVATRFKQTVLLGSVELERVREGREFGCSWRISFLSGLYRVEYAHACITPSKLC